MPYMQWDNFECHLVNLWTIKEVIVLLEYINLVMSPQYLPHWLATYACYASAFDALYSYIDPELTS